MYSRGDAETHRLIAELNELVKCSDALKSIMAMWSKDQRGVVLLDEVDLLLHPLKSELNFPIGAKTPIHMEADRWNIAVHLFESLFYRSAGLSIKGFKLNPEVTQLLKDITATLTRGVEENKLQSIGSDAESQLVLLQQGYYHSDLRPLMAKWAIEWLKFQAGMEPKGDEPGVLDEHAKTLGIDRTDLDAHLVEYVEGRRPQKPKAFDEAWCVHESASCVAYCIAPTTST